MSAQENPNTNPTIPFIYQTAKIYNLPYYTVKFYYNWYGNTEKLYEKLEEYVNKKRKELNEIMKSLKRFEKIIDSISDERENGDGIWVYLKKEYADFNYDPHHPTRQVHESTVKGIIQRISGGCVRKITAEDQSKYEHLKY